MEMVTFSFRGRNYCTPNGRRYYLGEPKTVKYEQTSHMRGHRKTTFLEVKHPRVLKALRRRTPWHKIYQLMMKREFEGQK